MSYCRWSSDDYKSDVYVYGSCYDQWVIHVASNKLIYHEDLPPKIDLTTSTVEEYVQRYKKVQEIPHSLEQIGLKYDGQSFYLDSPEECADMLLKLKETGYHVPEGVIEALREES